MICEDCGKCHSIKFDKKIYSINCSAIGEFNLHNDHVDNFRCTDKIDRELPQRDNVLIILKGGRDITVYDKNVKCIDDLDKLIIEERLEWAKCGNFTFNVSEIACYGYIGG